MNHVTQLDQILKSERHQMTSWARATLIEAAVAGSRWGMIAAPVDLTIAAHRQVEEVTERLHQGFLQATSGCTYTLPQWKEEVHLLRSRFTREILQLSLTLATRDGGAN